VEYDEPFNDNSSAQTVGIDVDKYCGGQTVGIDADKYCVAQTVGIAVDERKR